MLWTDLGYDDLLNYRVPCVRTFVEGLPGCCIQWLQDTRGKYTLRLTHRTQTGAIEVPIDGAYVADSCPPIEIVKAAEARLIAAGTVLFA